MTIGEAMSCGKPVVAASVGSLPEVVVDGETGFLVSPDNRRQLAARIVTLLRNDPVAQQFGEAGRRRVESLFRWELVAKRTLDLYRQVLCDGPRRDIASHLHSKGTQKSGSDLLDSDFRQPWPGASEATTEIRQDGSRSRQEGGGC